MADQAISAVAEISVPALDDFTVWVDNGVTTRYRITASRLLGMLTHMVQGRLTLATGTAYVTSSQTAKTTVYYTPYVGRLISLYDGTRWRAYSTAEISVAVPATTNTPFDVFAYDNAGTVTLETANWTNDTTRATALTTQDGVLVKTGALTRRYLGTGRTTGTSGETETKFIGDSAVDSTPPKWFLWNYYNRLPVNIAVSDSTDSWTYTTATFRQSRASALNQIEFVVGVAEDSVEAFACHCASNSSTGVDVGTGIDLDGTTTNEADVAVGATMALANGLAITVAQYSGRVAVGRHYLAWLEYSAASGTTTWYGDAFGLPYIKTGLQARFMA